MMTRRLGVVLLALGMAVGCGGTMVEGEEGSPLEQSIDTGSYNELNLAAGSMVLYEVQVRAANACHPDVGLDWQKERCRNKPAPRVVYRAQGTSCGMADSLAQIKLGTLDDMMEDTPDFRAGITLRYIRERVGANTVWLMPLFPNNDTWNIPDGCDNLGSPYAVRDYMHVSGMLSQRCIAEGADEHDAQPCWGNADLDRLIQDAHSRGLKVMLDVALNHFGHNYTMYDYVDFTPVRERIANHQDLNGLWNLTRTDEAALLHPEILDTVQELESLEATNPFHRANLGSLRARCPSLSGLDLVRAYNMWRVALDWERARFNCDAGFLEHNVPGFYMGSNAWDPSRRLGDNFTNNWKDVKFLYHREENAAHKHEFVRNREYLFRVLNYWVSRGVDAFRLDHTTDPDSGMGPNEWKYIVSKVDYYAWRRGQDRPVFLAEEFHDQMGMNKVVDIMTEGYVGDMTGRNVPVKDASRVESVLNNMRRFGDHAFVMTALETHDEHRLLDHTGFNIWTGAGFWGIGATTRSTPMMLMGQELGEPWGLGFRRSDFLRSRFPGTSQFNPSSSALTGYYKSMIKARLDPANRALLSPNQAYLRSRWTRGPDARIYAAVKWTTDGNVVFVLHNLWEQRVEQSYYIDSGLAGALSLRDDLNYKLVDVISNRQMENCRRGADLKWDFYVAMDAGTRAQWLRLERCQ